ncbi:MAG: hypothetical protein KC425_07000, partial [Anaerolineales bacterium]|nr:hypothetical protein [Anaerolineales bacterium]
LNAYLDGIRPAQRIHVRGSGAWADDSHRTTWLLQVDETALCLALAPELYPRMHTAWTRQLLATETAVWQALDQHLFDPYFDASVVADTVAALPDGARLFAGNSLPVRHLDQWARPSTRHLLAYANRGASGIDGNVSTALGIGAASSSRAPLVALLGDITFYHDLNGLLAVRGAAIRNPKSEMGNLTIVLLNNNGGGIFRRLPVQNIEPPFTDLFVTPHGLDFSGVIGMYGLAHERPQSRAAFQAALAASLANDVPTVIEVRTDGEQDEARRREVGRMVTG